MRSQLQDVTKCDESTKHKKQPGEIERERERGNKNPKNADPKNIKQPCPVAAVL